MAKTEQFSAVPFEIYAGYTDGTSVSVQAEDDIFKQFIIRVIEFFEMGKLVADTRLLVDALEQDERIDASRIGIAGHSLGGKMAFYTGCIDPRIKVILASDFGFLWHQTNWEKNWYFGDKVEALKAAGLSNVDLLSYSKGKPFFLIAGDADTDESLEAMKKASGYDNCPERLGFLNHASGHRPPQYALDEGYEFLEKYLK